MKCWCKVVELEDGLDGFFYHKQCGIQEAGIRSVAVDIDETPSTYEQAKFQSSIRVKELKPEPKPIPRPKFWVTLADGVGPTEPVNRPTREEIYTEVRKTYVMGVQIMIELQVKALVEKFKVCPIVVDMIEHVWLRFVDSTNIFSDDGADNAFNNESAESQFQGELKHIGKHKGEHRNAYGERCSMIWYRSLSSKIPLSCSLAISFLVCHLAREPILSTDITKWAHEGKLPYFTAFIEIDKHMQLPRRACSLTSSSMFRPTHVIPVQKLEAFAASIAQSIGLELPPVNFSAIASRYLKQLSLPVDIILPHACLIYEWSMPPELWLSANEFTLPAHAFILSILVVSIRILYNIHGFGKWEMSLSCAIDEKKSPDCNNDLDATEILVLLESKYNELIDTSDHAKDLEAYLEYCEKVVFAYEDQEDDVIMKNLSNQNEEDEIIKDLLKFYKEKKKDHKLSKSCSLSPSSPHKRPQDHSQRNTNKTKKTKLKITLDPQESHKDREIKRMKSNMEENKFCYIPPRKRVKRHDYLHYTRKKGGGAYVYAAHADYYILLRSCARVAQLDVRSMHAVVLGFERRLGWLEKNIQHSLKLMPCDDCQLCDLSQLIKLDDFS